MDASNAVHDAIAASAGLKSKFGSELSAGDKVVAFKRVRGIQPTNDAEVLTAKTIP